MLLPGHQFRMVREQLGLTMRDVELAAARIAAKHCNEAYCISLSRLSEIETKSAVPSIHRLYSLAVIYRIDVREILSWYGVDVNDAAGDLSLSEPPKSHRAELLNSMTAVRMPVRMDPAFNIKATTNLGRMVEQWGMVPLAYLNGLATQDFTYGYIGTEDLTMYPLLLPGSFIQVDESKNKVVAAVWHSEYERPIYFVEMRDGFACSWCAVEGDQLVLQPHPLSPQPVRVLRHPQEAEVLGQVVGVAMRLEWSTPLDRGTEPKGRAALN